MNLSTRQAAKKLGLSHVALAKHIKTGKVPAPQVVNTGTTQTHVWGEADIERVRKLLPKIKNGRKTRYQKKGTGGRLQGTARAKSKVTG